MPTIKSSNSLAPEPASMFDGSKKKGGGIDEKERHRRFPFKWEERTLVGHVTDVPAGLMISDLSMACVHKYLNVLW